MNEDAVAVSVALEIVLGQGRAFVRTVGLLPKQGDLPSKPSSRRVCADGAGQAAADDDEVGFGCREDPCRGTADGLR